MSRFPAFLAMTLLFAAPAALAQPQAPRVLVDRVETREIADTAPVIGRLVGIREAAVATRTAGIVKDVLVQVGDRVEGGQVLVRLDDRLRQINRLDLEASKATAEAGVAVAEARLRQTEQAFERTSQLRGSTAFSKGAFEDLEATAAQARSELVRARTQVAAAEAALARSDYELEHSAIRAPFGGVVLEREATEGEYLTLGATVAMLLDTGQMEIEADIPADLIAGLTPGRRVEGRSDTGGEMSATVRAIMPVETISTRTRAVRFEADLSAIDIGQRAAGTPVTLQIPVSAPRLVTMVPKDALVRDRSGWVVFVVKDGAAEKRPIEIGQASHDGLEVLRGLDPGEVVVIRGNERLRPGQPVQPDFGEKAPPAVEGTAAAPAGRS